MIATCFSAVSLGFVAVVASTLDVLSVFPLVVVSCFLAVSPVAAVLVGLPPT